MKHSKWTPADQSAYVEQRRALLGEQIRLARLKAKLTQAELARAIGKSVATVSKLEQGVQTCDVVLFSQIADVLRFDSTKAIFNVEDRSAKTDFQKAIAKIFRNVAAGPATTAKTRRSTQQKPRARSTAPRRRRAA